MNSVFIIFQMHIEIIQRSAYSLKRSFQAIKCAFSVSFYIVQNTWNWMKLTEMFLKGFAALQIHLQYWDEDITLLALDGALSRQ